MSTTLLAGCTDGGAGDRVITLDDDGATTAPQDDGDRPGVEEVPPADTPDDGGERGGEDGQDGQDAPRRNGADEPCGDELRTTLVARVDGQLDAIAERAWEDALAFATDGFRADIDADRFRQIILDGFPVVADAVTRDPGACRTVGDQASMLVTVQDDAGTQQLLQYLFERDDAGWGIGGAVPADAPGAGDDEDTVTA